jgi:predicted HTH domain antitoxin
MQVLVDLPDEYFSFYDKPTLAKEIQVSLALLLFKQSKISIGKAANIAGMDLYEFMKECKKNEISVISITVDELNDEWESIQKEFISF